MIGICDRCGRERRIENPKQEFKVCKSCYVCLHYNKEKSKVNNAKWRKNNLQYFRNYYKTHKSYWQDYYLKKKEKLKSEEQT